jgi:hypothetical protein
LWQRSSTLRYSAPALLVGSFAWANAPLFGFKLPLLGFSWGYLRCYQLGHWQAYKMVMLR